MSTRPEIMCLGCGKTDGRAKLGILCHDCKEDGVRPNAVVRPNGELLRFRHPEATLAGKLERVKVAARILLTEVLRELQPVANALEAYARATGRGTRKEFAEELRRSDDG